MPSVKSVNDLEEFEKILQEEGVTPVVLSRFLKRMRSYFYPEVERSSEEELAVMLDKAAEYIRAAAPGARLATTEIAEVGGFKTRSDKYRMRQLLEENNLLQFDAAQPEGWVKKIGNDPAPTKVDEAAD